MQFIKIDYPLSMVIRIVDYDTVLPSIKFKIKLLNDIYGANLRFEKNFWFKEADIQTFIHNLAVYRSIAKYEIVDNFTCLFRDINGLFELKIEAVDGKTVATLCMRDSFTGGGGIDFNFVSEIPCDCVADIYFQFIEEFIWLSPTL